MLSGGREAAKEEARRLLEAGELSIEEIAAETGLSEASVRGIKGALAKASRRAAGVGVGGPSKGLESPIPDLFAELPAIKDAVVFSRWKARLRQQDPQLFRVFFPEAVAAEVQDPTNRLVNLELVRYLRAMREEEETKAQAKAQPAQNNPFIQNLFGKQNQLMSRIEKLEEELKSERERRLEQRIDFLEKRLEDKEKFDYKIRELDFLDKRARGIGEKIDRLAGGRIAAAFQDRVLKQYAPEYVGQPSERVPEAQPNLEELKKHGLCVTVIDKGPQRYILRKPEPTQEGQT